MHPRYQLEKEYRVLVEGNPTGVDLEQLRSGVVLPDGTVTSPARVRTIDGHRNLLSITVTQGKKRQIRLMARAMGHPVIELERVRIDGIELDDLPEGQWRKLTEEEVASVWRHAR
jgi:pseudouridine synthase